MICNKCGKEVPDNFKFCPFCANSLDTSKPVENGSNQPAVQPAVILQQVSQPAPPPGAQAIPNPVPQPVYSAPTGNGSFTKSQKMIIIGLLSLVVIVLGIVVFGGGSSLSKKKDDTRTIMIYLVGNDLESNNGIATADIEAMSPDKIDLDKVNILVYAGGTKDWKNDYISSDENAIFKLTEDGFEKIKTIKKNNMGDPSTFVSFLNYAYDNYKAGHYDLILYNHGSGLLGAVADEFTEDLLSLEDFRTALKKSPFGKDNKFDTVIFRTCLNGMLEVANLFKDYSEYIVFSEEVSWGANYSDVLSFINKVELSDNGDAVGKKFVDRYGKQMEEIDMFGTAGFTYSLIDLSKIDTVVDELDKFIGGIDLKKDYSNISRIRGNLYQYGGSEDVFDSVDLLSFVKQAEKYSSVKADKLISAIEDAIVYNNTNIKESNGISIYFPFKGRGAVSRFLQVYKKLDFSDNYEAFINKFYSTMLNGDRDEFALHKDTFSTNSDKEVTLTLSEDEANYYSYSDYYVFKRDKDHPNYYQYIYSSDDAVVDGNNITTNIGNNLIKVKDGDTEEFIPLNHRTKGGMDSFSISAILMDDLAFTEKGHSFVSYVNFYFPEDKPKIASATIASSDDERLLGVFLDLEKFKTLDIFFFEYKLLDAYGNVVDDWESPPERRGVEVKTDEVEFAKASLDNDGEYYVLFKIYDLNNESHFSKLMKVGM